MLGPERQATGQIESSHSSELCVSNCGTGMHISNLPTNNGNRPLARVSGFNYLLNI